MTTQGEPAAPTWEQVTAGLAATLPQLEDRSVLTISWSAVPTVYVQVEQSATETVALTGADDVLGPDRSLRPTDRFVLEAAGWAAPEVDPTGRRTWRTSVPWPVRTEEYEQLAFRCVNVLRLVHGVPNPEELEYRAWRDAEPPPEHELYYEENLDPAEPHLSLPRLGLRDARGS